MEVLWSYAATGLSMAVLGLYIGQPMIHPVNRPNLFRKGLGELVFGLTGLLLTVFLLFFGFRLFWDNGMWGLLQVFVMLIVTGFLGRLQFLHASGLTPIVLAVLCSFQAYKIW